MATIAAGVFNGADIVRVHNVKKALETVRIIDAILIDEYSPEVPFPRF
jgi:dihydropteroate synthase